MAITVPASVDSMDQTVKVMCATLLLVRLTLLALLWRVLLNVTVHQDTQ